MVKIPLEHIGQRSFFSIFAVCWFMVFKTVFKIIKTKDVSYKNAKTKSLNFAVFEIFETFDFKNRTYIEGLLRPLKKNGCKLSFLLVLTYLFPVRNSFFKTESAVCLFSIEYPF